MYGLNHFTSLHGYNFILKDGRTFNAHGKNVEEAIDELKEYLYCEYNETTADIATVEQYN